MISCIFEGSTQWGCVSQDFYSRRFILREQRIFGLKHAVKISKGTWHQIEIRERKGPSRGIIPKYAPHESGPCAPKFEERTPEETSRQEEYARKAAWDLGKFLKAQEFGHSYVLFSC